MTLMIRDLEPHWVVLQPYMVIETEQDYERLVTQINEFVDFLKRNKENNHKKCRIKQQRCKRSKSNWNKVL